MILMALDHVRDFIARSAMHFSPTNLTHTSVFLFLTRWSTHLCAPVFILTAGIGASLWKQRGHHSRSELSVFLVTRGLWLILIELTIMRLIMFSQVSYRAQPTLLLILWAIGLSMVVLALLQFLPLPLLALLSASVILFHNLLDPIRASSLGRAAPLWYILHTAGGFSLARIPFFSAYPVLPWIGVIGLGFCLSVVFTWDERRRQHFLIASGLALTLAFLALRAFDHYGDPSPWAPQHSALFTALSFLNATKYPPSLDFLLMTLGPALLGLALLERLPLSSANPLIVFGRVPFFFYVTHLFLAHLVAILLNLLRYGAKPFLLLAPPSMGGPEKLFPATYGFALWVAYAVWILVVVLLYPACLWFSCVKQRRRDWWLSYL